MIKVTIHEETKGDGKTIKPCTSPRRNQDSAVPHPLICTGAGPIHPVHGLPKLRATKAMPSNEVTFSPFLREFSHTITKMQLVQIEHKIRPSTDRERMSQNSKGRQ